MADDDLIDESGTVHERTWTGAYRPSTGVFGETKDVGVFGQPNVQRDVFGNPKVKRNFWGGEVRSAGGEPLYLRGGSGGGSGALESMAGTWVGILLLICLAILVGIVVVYFLAVRKVLRFASERILGRAVAGSTRLATLLPRSPDLLPRHGAIANRYVNCAAALTMVTGPVLIALLLLPVELISRPDTAAGGWVVLAVLAGLAVALTLGTASVLPVARFGHLGGLAGALGLLTITVLAWATIAVVGSSIAPTPAQAALPGPGATSAGGPAGGAGLSTGNFANVVTVRPDGDLLLVRVAACGGSDLRPARRSCGHVAPPARPFPRSL